MPSQNPIEASSRPCNQRSLLVEYAQWWLAQGIQQLSNSFRGTKGNFALQIQCTFRSVCSVMRCAGIYISRGVYTYTNIKELIA